MSRKTVALWAAPVAAIVVMVVAPSALAQKKQSSIPWQTSLAKAKQIAAKQKKPLMVDFSATWCPPCNAMKQSTWKDAAVIERARRFVPVLIDIDKQPKVTEQAGVTGVPTIVFYSSAGKELERAEGYRDARGMLLIMASAERKAGGK